MSGIEETPQTQLRRIRHLHRTRRGASGDTEFVDKGGDSLDELMPKPRTQKYGMLESSAAGAVGAPSTSRTQAEHARDHRSQPDSQLARARVAKRHFQVEIVNEQKSA